MIILLAYTTSSSVVSEAPGPHDYLSENLLYTSRLSAVSTHTAVRTCKALNGRHQTMELIRIPFRVVHIHTEYMQLVPL
jgi:hypothetical protein